MKYQEPIAVIGMAGLFPQASDLKRFWQNIINKVDATHEVPPGRWSVPPDYAYTSKLRPDKAYSKRCCLITDFDFESGGIDIDKRLLAALDPLYHMVLHAGRQALAGIPPRSLSPDRTGAILAAIALPTEVSSAVSRKILAGAFEEKIFSGSRELRAEQPLSLSRERCLAAKVVGLPAAILTEAFGFGAGSYTLDAACASSLYAVKLACDALDRRQADVMLAGGVSRPDCLYTQIGFSQLQALSPSGRCAPFDKSADGLVVGEGAGILVLKRLGDALDDKDEIHGLIQGIGISNDMHGNLLAPDTEGQVRAMRSAYDGAGWAPQSIDIIECHGAGTPVGDATELRSLSRVWGKKGWERRQCAIGSVKSMIGHLLTAAGAAGLIKTLLALQHKTLPPSLNFSQAPPNSPLEDGPFRVQTEPEPWHRRKKDIQRRAAVSAFGFGGINAHVLVEEWDPALSPGRHRAKETRRLEKISGISKKDKSNHLQAVSIMKPKVPVAIIGMHTVLGSYASLSAFKEAVFNGHSNILSRPEQRWKGCDEFARGHSKTNLPKGGFMDEISIQVGEFHIPPKEIPDILPQHLLMLKVAAKAMADAGLPLREERPQMGALIGIDFDFESTNYSVRWHLAHLIASWESQPGSALNEKNVALWMDALNKSLNPPLTATRTLGALGGIVASRIAREFRFGGASFVVSCEEASGLKALEIGIRSVQQNETDAVLVGAVDLSGDIRNILLNSQLETYSQSQRICPFDKSADGSLPGEGAVAVVIKRLDRAIADGNRIYAVIKGIGGASGGGINARIPAVEAYKRSLGNACQDAGVTSTSIGFYEAHGSGIPHEDNLESEALNDCFEARKEPCAIGSVKPTVGHTGAVSGLASVIKASLALYHEIIPPLKNFSTPQSHAWNEKFSRFPILPEYWIRNRNEGPRRAMVGTLTGDGNCMHVVLEGIDGQLRVEMKAEVRDRVERERKNPLGLREAGLFVIEADDRQSLLGELMVLNQLSQSTLAKPLNSKHHRRHESIEHLARAWYRGHPCDRRKTHCVSIVCKDASELRKQIMLAREAVSADGTESVTGAGVYYSPAPLGGDGQLSFVFPGSGNHYLGMGREAGLHWPEVLREMDAQTQALKSQLLPRYFIPWRVSWEPGWQKTAYEQLAANPLNLIFGQVAHGSVMANLIQKFGIQPNAVIGYSLGESAAYFAMGVWPERGEMLERMQTTDLFTTELAGPCNAARRAWSIPETENVDWCTAVVNRPASQVGRVVAEFSTARLLIINTSGECVIGGRRNDVMASIEALGCEAIFLDGVVTVHCDALAPVADDYRKLHVFPTRQPPGIRFYSCALGRAYHLSSEKAASSILHQALHGFDFSATINQAYLDGVRVFLEMGPYSSCTRMINSILGSKPHLAVSACVRSENDFNTIVKVLAALAAERVPLDLSMLYGPNAYPPETIESSQSVLGQTIKLKIGGKPITFALPETPDPQSEGHRPAAAKPHVAMLEVSNQISTLTSDAHRAFLDFSGELTGAYSETFDLQKRLLEFAVRRNTFSGSRAGDQIPNSLPAFSRQDCLEFATGSAANVLGAEFSVVDTYKTRVRLPDEPLMLVDRIIAVEGSKGSLGSGRIVTEHDVLPGAWYLDGDRAPVCISVEAGQADLFLCAYLGIDLKVKGLRTYRLLDATVKFHRGLPRSGETIRYEITIDKFIRQAETYLFLFNFKGFIGDAPLISMSNGRAGFFTKEEVQSSGGILFTEEENRPQTGQKPGDWKDLVPLGNESYSDTSLQKLRAGNLAGCFGDLFQGVRIADALKLPGGRMKLIDRIIQIVPDGGRFGLGLIRAEADIHPDDWFLTCHFVDDMVMPGTLMYECCAQALRVFLQRLGWVSDKPGVCYEPVVGIESTLKCRGPVTPETRRVIYEVEIKEIGYAPEPYVVADAHMHADGQRIVWFKDMSMKLSGASRREIENFWDERKQLASINEISKPTQGGYSRNHILEFATGKPSAAFGSRYIPFDTDRFIARLPAPPYLFIDRIALIEPQPWLLKPDGWIEAEYDVLPDSWFFRAERTAAAPISIVIEIALQPCGWLAAYMGSALRSDKDLHFRNLGGHATLHQEIRPDAKTLRTRTRLTRSSEAGDMIIEHFDFEVLQQDRRIYSGNAYFGFFTPSALAQQEGIRETHLQAYQPDVGGSVHNISHDFKDEPPLWPGDSESETTSSLAMPAKAIRMIDRIETYIPDGGPSGLGFIRGSKTVDPQEWFFKAHFFQDPVFPGSLGIESFVQLLKFAARGHWPDLINSHRFKLLTDRPHEWIYRGQITPLNRQVTVEAAITEIRESPLPALVADGFIKVDNLYIYELHQFGIQLIPLKGNPKSKEVEI